MKLADLPLLADENIQSEVVGWLRTRGVDTVAASDLGLTGAPDEQILRAAHADGRTVLTHDADFGLLSIARKAPMIGIIYVRPGHIQARVAIETVETILNRAIDFEPPFILVARRTENEVAIRVRSL